MIVDELWQRYRGLTWADVPASTRTVARQCVTDWLACTIAGSREPLALILRAEYGGVDGPCAVFGSDLRAPVQVAALINGATGHALDFDDTSTVMGGHPSAPVVPAVLAVAEELGATGEAALTAIVVGIEVESRLGMLIGGEHYARGWHVTSTMGVFGAAAGVAHLMQLDAAAFGNAMGLAASQASGLKANFGTMTKPFHAGHAAERGVLAARLAKRGFTANAGSFEGNQGLVQAASGGRLSRGKFDALDAGWLTEHVLFKYHAACYLTHASIECLLKLGNAVGSDVSGVSLTVHPSLLDVCGIPNPKTGLEGKFSLRGTTALTALGYDTTDPATFSDENLTAPPVRALIDRVTVVTDDSLATTQTRVTVNNDTGAFDAFHDTGIPASDLEAQQQKLEAKFNNIVGPVLGGATARMLDSVSRFDEARSVAGWL